MSKAGKKFMALLALGTAAAGAYYYYNKKNSETTSMRIVFFTLILGRTRSFTIIWYDPYSILFLFGDKCFLIQIMTFFIA